MELQMRIEPGAPSDAKAFFKTCIVKGFLKGETPYRDAILAKASERLKGKIPDRDRAVLPCFEGGFGGDNSCRQLRFTSSLWGEDVLGIDVQDDGSIGKDVRRYSIDELAAILGALSKVLEEDFAERFGWTPRYCDPEKEQGCSPTSSSAT